jgi:hypothetical protein
MLPQWPPENAAKYKLANEDYVHARILSDNSSSRRSIYKKIAKIMYIT